LKGGMTGPEHFAVREEWELPTRRIGRKVLVYDRLESTNTQAAALAARGAGDGLALLADEQSAGRGQHGRTWVAPPRSSVLLSVLLYPPSEVCRPVVLTTWAAVSVCEMVRRWTGIQPGIKWPNDVLVRGQKVCGILIEQSQQGAATATVAGIGLNVAQTAEDFAAAGLPLATSLSVLGASEGDTHAVARALLGQLDEEYDRLCRGERTVLEACWKLHLGLLGEDVVAECADGVRQGRLLEVAFDGVVLDGGDGPVLLAPEAIQHLSRLP
jgi:BirA family biotin operon repressor/biotin-[acetyl-CoA-carboxylase] ligase